MPKSDTLEYVKNLNARRKRRKTIGWGSILLGIITYLDAGWEFPIWLTGIWAFALGTPLIILGVGFLVASYKLPIRETLLFASTQDGKITAPALSMGLDITLDTSELILDHLVKRGYAQVSTEEMEEGAVIYKITGIQKF